MPRPSFRLEFLATTTGPDGADEGRAPDTDPLGDVTVTCTPSIAHIIYPPSASGEPYETSFVRIFKATTGPDGRLKGPDGESGIELPAADPTAAPTGFSWKVEARWGGRASFAKTFPAPPGGTVVDFSTVIAQPANPSAELAAWTAAVTTTTAARDETLAARDDALAAANTATSAAATATSAATTATNAATTAAIGGFLSGTGSPQGVLAAPVGSQYRDTAATTGAVIWVKEAGTGTSGWRVSDGDTGWRDVTSLLDPSWAVNTTAPTCKLRRIGADAYFDARLIVPAGSALIGVGRTIPTVVLITPTGFAGSSFVPVGVASVTQDAVFGAPLFSSTIAILSLRMTSGRWAEGQAVSLSAQWVTPTPWPTTLPGTPTT